MNRKIPTLAILIIILATLACGKLAIPVDRAGKPSATPPTPEREMASNPCANVFLPFNPGYQWIYQVEREEGEDAQIGLTVSKVEGPQATLDMLEISTGAIVQSRVECEDGAIKNYPALSLGTLFGDNVSGDVTIIYVSGIYMPAKEEFLAANWNLTWSGEYIANGIFTVEEQDQTIIITLDDSPVRMAWQVEGQEPITVQAGTFDQAYKVTRRIEMNVKVDLEGLVVQAILMIDTEQWYEAGVGLLKSEVAEANLRYLGITFPIYIKGEVKLVEFRPGQ